MCKVLTYGTFDTLHYGHIRLLTNAADLGSSLYVGISGDTFNELKGKKAYHDYETRKKHVEALRCVDEVFVEKNWEQKVEDIQRLNIDIFVMGDDWVGKFDNLNQYCKVIYLPRTPSVSSTILRSYL